MAFRAIYIASLILLVFNIGGALHFSGSNAVEKTAFLLAALAILLRKGADKSILFLLVGQIFLVFVLAAATPYKGFSWSIFFASLNQIIILFALLAGRTGFRDQQAIWKATAYLPLLCAVLGFAYHFTGMKPMTAIEFATGLSRYLGSLSAAAFTSALGMCGVFAAVQLVLGGPESLRDTGCRQSAGSACSWWQSDLGCLRRGDRGFSPHPARNHNYDQIVIGRFRLGRRARYIGYFLEEFRDPTCPKWRQRSIYHVGLPANRHCRISVYGHWLRTSVFHNATRS